MCRGNSYAGLVRYSGLAPRLSAGAARAEDKPNHKCDTRQADQHDRPDEFVRDCRLRAQNGKESPHIESERCKNPKSEILYHRTLSRLFSPANKQVTRGAEHQLIRVSFCNRQASLCC